MQACDDGRGIYARNCSEASFRITGFQSPDKGGPSVVLIILAGDIITIVFALLWLFRWR